MQQQAGKDFNCPNGYTFEEKAIDLTHLSDEEDSVLHLNRPANPGASSSYVMTNNNRGDRSDQITTTEDPTRSNIHAEVIQVQNEEEKLQRSANDGEISKPSESLIEKQTLALKRSQLEASCAREKNVMEHEQRANAENQRQTVLKISELQSSRNHEKNLREQQAKDHEAEMIRLNSSLEQAQQENEEQRRAHEEEISELQSSRNHEKNLREQQAKDHEAEMIRLNSSLEQAQQENEELRRAHEEEISELEASCAREKNLREQQAKECEAEMIRRNSSLEQAQQENEEQRRAHEEEIFELEASCAREKNLREQQAKDHEAKMIRLNSSLEQAQQEKESCQLAYNYFCNELKASRNELEASRCREREQEQRAKEEVAIATHKSVKNNFQAINRKIMIEEKQSEIDLLNRRLSEEEKQRKESEEKAKKAAENHKALMHGLQTSCDMKVEESALKMNRLEADIKKLIDVSKTVQDAKNLERNLKCELQEKYVNKSSKRKNRTLEKSFTAVPYIRTVPVHDANENEHNQTTTGDDIDSDIEPGIESDIDPGPSKKRRFLGQASAKKQEPDTRCIVTSPPCNPVLEIEPVPFNVNNNINSPSDEQIAAGILRNLKNPDLQLGKKGGEKSQSK